VKLFARNALNSIAFSISNGYGKNKLHS
jgi:hypothetical protein